MAHYFFEGLAALADKPVLVSEFFCAAMENRSGNKNAGHLLKVPTQTERAIVVQQALQNFARRPNIIGTNWFQTTMNLWGGGRMARIITWGWSISMTNLMRK